MDKGHYTYVEFLGRVFNGKQAFWGSQFVCLNVFWFEWIEGLYLKDFRALKSSPCPFNDDFGQGQLLPYPLICDRWCCNVSARAFLWTEKDFKIQSVLSRLKSLTAGGRTNKLISLKRTLLYLAMKSFHCKNMYWLVFEEYF